MLLILTNNLKTLNISKLDEKIIHYCNNKFSLDQTIFKELDCTNISILERPHKMILITLLTKKYLSVRLKSLGKTISNTFAVSKRHKLTKLILFSNQ